MSATEERGTREAREAREAGEARDARDAREKTEKRTGSGARPGAGKKRKRWKAAALILLSMLVLLVGGGFAYESIASERAKSDYPMPGKLVDAGGYRLHLNRVGDGPYTIVLEAGSGETSLSWNDIPERLSSIGTVVSYDRAGYAWSEKAPTERTGANIVRELHHALQQEGLQGPYIVVGHSLGGMYARLFAQEYREEVAGLVLVDARPENNERDSMPIYEEEHFRDNKPSAGILSLMKRSGVLRLFQDVLLEGMVEKEERGVFVNVVSKPSYFQAVENEGELASTTEDAIRGQRLGDLPVKVIARNVAPDFASYGMSEQGGEKLERIWRQGQREMLGISNDSEFIVAEKSGHMVMDDEPDLVVDVIRGLVERLEEQPAGAR